jgi:probable H4MPT-linked C1 transfer pathway protein
MPPTVLGLDVGGANLKAAHTDGTAVSRPFALWKRPADLAAELRELVAGFPPFDRLAVTMTGELCDCFATKSEGVRHILTAIAEVAGGVPTDVWRTDGRFTNPARATADPLPAAAANWLALATWAGRFAPDGPALLVDVGSTTTDVIALFDGRPVPEGRTDTERMRFGELVYTGVRRTPVCALLGWSVMAELFATTLDAYLILDRIPEGAADCDTADGRPATRGFAHARLARMLGGEAGSVGPREVRALARRVFTEQRRRVREALLRQAGRLPGPPRRVIVSGSGTFLAEATLPAPRSWTGVTVDRLADRLSPALSEAACAYAVAVLAAERSA